MTRAGEKLYRDGYLPSSTGHRVRLMPRWLSKTLIVVGGLVMWGSMT